MGDPEEREDEEDYEEYMRYEEEIEPKPLPRWFTILVGLLLAPITLICVIGSATIVVDPFVPITFITISIGTVFLIGSLWVFYLSVRMIFSNPSGQGKFISPLLMRLVALVFLAIPIAALATGSFWEKPVIHSIMTIAYIGIVVRLWTLSKYRENA